MERLSPLNPVRNLHISSCLKAKTVLNKYDSGFWCDNSRCTFSLEEALLWIMDSNFAQKRQFKVKNIRSFLKTSSFWLLKTFIDGLEWIIVMFLSAVWTLILTAPIHCRGSTGEQVMECYISPHLLQKQTHLHLGWPEGEDIFSKFSFFVSVSLWCRYPTFSFLLLSVAFRLQNS